MGTESLVKSYADDETNGAYMFMNFIFNENLITLIEEGVEEEFENWG